MRIRLLICLLISVFLLPPETQAQAREEFNGPFSGWADVKQRFGARGDGRTDDTHAIQAALDSLSCLPTNFNMGKTGYMVVYLPAGTYCISSTLVLKGKIGVSFIGEDPGKTIIKWMGPEKDTLFWANGSAYFKLSRITWNANGKKEMEGVGIHWNQMWSDGKTRSFASLNIEISDNFFIGGFMYGISGGTFAGQGTGANDSEIAIRRCSFSNCTIAGIDIKGFNALDYWIWDCKFLLCSCGVQCSRGGYHLYRCFFSGSSLTDVHNTHGYYNSVRGCYSVNSRMLSADETISSNPFKRTFQDNTVISPQSTPILYYHLGKITLFGNKFTATRDTANKICLSTHSGFPGIYEVLSLHNTYPYDNAIRIGSTPNKIYSYGDKKTGVTPAVQAFLGTMDLTPPKRRRKIFEVSPGADAGRIQSILDQAALLKGQRPVVHFGMGTYLLDKPLVIAEGSDMQLIGDGLLYATIFIKKPGVNFQSQGFILVNGPSYVTIEDIQLGKDGEKDQPAGIVFRSVDQPGAQAHLDQIYSHADTSVVMKELDNLYVQKDNSFFADGNYVSGGPLVQKGGGTAGLYCYGGQFANVRVENNGRFLARDCWWEGEKRTPLDLQGWGAVCIDGVMIAPNRPDSMPAIRIGKFKGHISLMNMYVQGALLPAGNNPDLTLLAWNIHFYHKMDVLNFLRSGANYKGAFLGLTAQCFRNDDPACKEIISIADKLVNVPDVDTFLDRETAFDRVSRPVIYKDLAKGISNIYISRISITGTTNKGVVFTGK